jgi:CDP-6-deoxy-D-xylo-4-hexulose-3-dehydrase
MTKKFPKIYYGKAVYGYKEINAVSKVLKNQKLQLIDGPNVKKLETKITKLFGKKYGLMTNSGSSSNLLALASFNFKKGSEIITPLLTFSTTVAPIVQLGLIPHFIGVKKNTFLCDISQIEKSINKNTVAIMIPNLLGNIPDWKKISQIAKKYNLKVIEDSADTIGYKLNKKNTGKLSNIVTTSFYASHIITAAGFGGMVCFNDQKLYERAKLLRGWGRNSSIFNEKENIKLRFNAKISGISYDSKYIFSLPGYNFLPSEMGAAFALEQLKSLKKNIEFRKRNFKYFLKLFKKYPQYFEVPFQLNNIDTCWLAYPIIVKKNKYFNRRDLQIYLEKENIQTRTIFTGNIVKQPIIRHIKFKKCSKSEEEANNIMKNGILIGCHHGMSKKELHYINTKITKFLK